MSTSAVDSDELVDVLARLIERNDWDMARVHARSALDAIRKETIERCAKLAESMIGAGRREIADAIRALSTAPKGSREAFDL
jgi:hypothetical protein